MYHNFAINIHVYCGTDEVSYGHIAEIFSDDKESRQRRWDRSIRSTECTAACSRRHHRHWSAYKHRH